MSQTFDELGNPLPDQSALIDRMVVLADDINEWIDKVHEYLPAFEQNQARHFQRRIGRVVFGDDE